MNIPLIVSIVVVIILLIFYYASTLTTTPTATTPTTTTPTTTTPIYSYVGCYADQTTARDLPNEYGDAYNFVDVPTCYGIAKGAGAKYFGLQWASGSPTKTTAQCWYGPSYGKFGTAATCAAKDPSGNLLGASSSNAIYQIN